MTDGHSGSVSNRFDAEREVARLLLDGDGSDGTVAQAAVLLVEALTDLVADEPFWNRISRGLAHVPAIDRRRLALLFALDWPAILERVGYNGRPPAEYVAAELLDAIRRTTGADRSDPAMRRPTEPTASPRGGGPWDTVDDPWIRLRWSLRDLAHRLGEDMERGEVSRGVRARVAGSFNALRQVNLVDLLLDTIDEVRDKGEISTAGLVLPQGWLGVVASLTLGVGINLIRQLRDIKRSDRRQATDAGLDRAFESGVLGRGARGRALANLRHFMTAVEERADMNGDLELVVPEPGDAFLVYVRDWLAAAGAELAGSWAVIGAVEGRGGLARLDAVTSGLRDLREAMSVIDTAMAGTSRAQVAVSVDRALAAFGDFGDQLDQLERLLIGIVLTDRHREGPGPTR